jgi:hypothetical protein
MRSTGEKVISPQQTAGSRQPAAIATATHRANAARLRLHGLAKYSLPAADGLLPARNRLRQVHCVQPGATLIEGRLAAGGPLEIPQVEEETRPAPEMAKR